MADMGRKHTPQHFCGAVGCVCYILSNLSFAILLHNIRVTGNIISFQFLRVTTCVIFMEIHVIFLYFELPYRKYRYKKPRCYRLLPITARFVWRRRWDSNPRSISLLKRFRVVLVMTTSIRLHITGTSPENQLYYFITFHEKNQPLLKNMLKFI